MMRSETTKSGGESSSASSHVDSWDPMAEEFNSVAFNSYDRGPGSQLPVEYFAVPNAKNKTAARKQGIKLYVVGIPSDMSEDRLRDLFSSYGNVISIYKGFSKKPTFRGTCFGFVEFATLADAQRAMNSLHDKPPLNLKIKFAENKDERQKKEALKQEEMSAKLKLAASTKPLNGPSGLLGSLDSAQKDALSSIQVTVTQTSGEHVVRQINMNNQSSPSSNCSITRSNLQSCSLRHSKLTSTESCQYCVLDEVHTHIIKICGKGLIKETVILDCYEDKIIEHKCMYCHAAGKYMCSGCQGWYCAQKCQVAHWPVHKNECCASIKQIIPNESNSPSSRKPMSPNCSGDSEFLSNGLKSPKPCSLPEDGGEMELVNQLHKKPPQKSMISEKSPSPQQNKSMAIIPPKLSTPPKDPPHSETSAVLKNLLSPPQNLCNAKKSLSFLEEPKSSSSSLEKFTIPKETLSADSSTDVFKVFQKGPRDICLAKVENLPKIGELQNALQEIVAAGKPLSFVPSIGSFCAARYPLDQLLYRAQVKNIDKSTYTVYYIDFGNEERVSVSDLFPLPSELATLPAQAIHCSLAGIKLTSQNINSATVIDQLEKLLDIAEKLSAIVVGESLEGKPLVDLKNESGDQMSNLLIQLGDVEPLDQEGEAVPDVNSNFVADPSNKENTMEPCIGSVIGKFKTTEEIQFYVAVIDSSLEKICLVSILDEALKLNAIEKCMNSDAGRLGPLSDFKPRKDDFVAAFSPLYMQWYRSLILQVNDNGYTVYYVDYGNQENVDRVAPLKPEYQQCDSGLVQAYVTDRESPEAERYLKSLKPEDTIHLCVKSVSENEVVLETLRGPHLTFIGKPWYHGVMMEASSLARKGDNKSCPERVMAKDIKQRDIEPTFIGYPIHIASEGIICLHVESEKTQLDELNKEMNAHMESLGDVGPYTPIPNEIVCARSLDGKWYRSKVIKVELKVATVTFVDYGYAEEIHVENIRPIPKNFAQQPFFAVFAELEGVPKEYIEDDMFDTLKETPFQITVTARGNYLKIKMFAMDSGLCVNSLMLGEEEASPVVPNPETQKYFYADFPRRRLPLGKQLEVLLCSVISTNEIYCIPCDAESKEMASKLQEMKSHCENDKECYKPEVGEIVAVYDAEIDDGGWYRAAIRSIAEDGEVECLLIDLGFLSGTKLSHIRRLPPAFATSCPQQSIRCSLGLDSSICNDNHLVANLQEDLAFCSMQVIDVIAEDKEAIIIRFPKLASELSAIGLYK